MKITPKQIIKETLIVGLLLTLIAGIWFLYIKAPTPQKKLFDVQVRVLERFEFRNNLYIVGSIEAESDTILIVQVVPPDIYGVASPETKIYLPIDSADLKVIKRINDRIIQKPKPHGATSTH